VHENYQNLLILVVMGGMGKQEQCNTDIKTSIGSQVLYPKPHVTVISEIVKVKLFKWNCSNEIVKV